MIVGYCRTSTAEQEYGLEAQLEAVKVAGAERIFSEQVSSVAARAQLEAALDFVREGDTLLVTKLDRLARSTRDALAIRKAKEAGKYKGRAATARAKADDVRRMHGEGKSATEIATALGIGRASVYRMLPERQ